MRHRKSRTLTPQSAGRSHKIKPAAGKYLGDCIARYYTAARSRKARLGRVYQGAASERHQQGRVVSIMVYTLFGYKSAHYEKAGEVAKSTMANDISLQAQLGVERNSVSGSH